MARYLVYAEVPLDAAQLADELATAGSVEVLVPVRDLTVAEQQFLEAERSVDQADQPAELFARWRLRHAIGVLSSLGFEHVHGDIVFGRPLDAIAEAVDRGSFDAVVAVTKPSGLSGWVHLDLPSRVERHIGPPVIHIELQPAHAR